MIDTSAVYALLDRSDNNHDQAKAILKQLQVEKFIPLLTNYIEAECHALITTKLGAELGRKWLRENSWPVERAEAEDEIAAKELIYQYTDKDFTLVDAITFIIMQRLNIQKAFAFDRHFVQMGYQVLPKNWV